MRVLTTVLKQTEGMVSLDGILYNEAFAFGAALCVCGMGHFPYI